MIDEETISFLTLVRPNGAAYVAFDGTGLMVAIGPTVGAVSAALRYQVLAAAAAMTP